MWNTFSMCRSYSAESTILHTILFHITLRTHFAASLAQATSDLSRPKFSPAFRLCTQMVWLDLTEKYNSTEVLI